MMGSFKAIWDFSGKEQVNIKKSVAVGLVFALFNTLPIMALYVVLSALVENRVDGSTALTALAIMLMSVAGRIATQYFSQLQRTHASYFMVANERLRIGEQLVSAPMGYFNRNSLGVITAVETTTLDDVENMAPIVLVNMLGGFLDTLVFAAMFVAFDWRVGLVAVAGMVLFLLLTWVMERRAHAGVPQRQEVQADLLEAVLEHVQGMAVVKAFDLDRGTDRKVGCAVEASRKANLGLEYGMAPLVALQQLVLNLMSVIMMLAAIWLCLQDALPLASCLVCIVASFMIFGQLKAAGSAMAGLRIVESSLARVREEADVPAMEGGIVDESPRSHDIVFDHVSFSYGGRPVLSDVSLAIPDGKLTAIVGPSGSGKTTFCSLISRFWDVGEGAVRLGGIDVRDFRLEALMGNVSAVFQDVYLFDDTIENNIRFGNPDASFEQVADAARRACCEDFIEALPQGYQTPVGEGGAALSGGEKQRISIARALLKDAPVVIFDEATANVDPENENKLQGAIEELTHSKTVVMIAHRLKTVRNADQIVVLTDGGVTQCGTHDELIGQEGMYKRFVEARHEAAGWKIGTVATERC